MSDEARKITVVVQGNDTVHFIHLEGVERSSRARANPGTGCWSCPLATRSWGAFHSAPSPAGTMSPREGKRDGTSPSPTAV